MNFIFEFLAENLGITIETVITFIALFGGMIVYARDFKIGMIVHILLFSGLFIVFRILEMNFRIPLTLFLIFLAILSLSIFFVAKESPVTARGGLI